MFFFTTWKDWGKFTENKKIVHIIIKFRKDMANLDILIIIEMVF